MQSITINIFKSFNNILYYTFKSLQVERNYILNVKKYSLETLISDMLEKNSLEFANSPAIINDDIILTYSNLNQQINKIVSLLEKELLMKNICIALRFNNVIQSALFSLSLIKMGITQIIINPNISYEYQTKTVEDINVDLVIQDMPLNNVVNNQTLYITNKLNIEKNYTKLKKSSDLPKDTLAIVIGSGTSTGERKHLYLSSHILALRYIDSFKMVHGKTYERVFCYTKIYYPSSTYYLIASLLKGMTMVIPNKAPKDIVLFCINNKIDHILLTSSQAFNFLLKNEAVNTNDINQTLKLPNLKSCVLSGSIISESLRKTIMSTITKNLYVLYGTNEFSLISEATPNDVIKYPGTVGKVFDNIELKILNNNGRECKTGEIGHIWIKSNSMMTAYFNNKEATNKAFEKGGFFPGDMGKLTDDGNLIFECRSDDMMIFAGENIYPRELEFVLESHSKVDEAAVFPMVIKNQVDVPFAVVVVNDTIDEKSLLRYCQKKLGWRSPKRIFATKKLPKNEGGKILKRELIKDVMKFFN